KEDINSKYGNADVLHGNELTPSQVRLPPTYLAWPTEPETLYTLLMNDPDVPSNAQDILHWAIVNIAGTNVATGETLGQYFGPSPPKGSRVHRYIFRLYRQNSKLNLKRFTTRTAFNVTRFAVDNHLEGPIAENFFVSQFLQ